MRRASSLPTAKVGVPFYFGTHYLALHMFEGFLKRDEIAVWSCRMGSHFYSDLLMQGEIEVTTMTEPYVTLAESDRGRSAAYFPRGGIWMASASCSFVSGADMNLKSMASCMTESTPSTASGCRAAFGMNSSRMRIASRSETLPYPA